MTDIPAYNFNLDTPDLLTRFSSPSPFDLVRSSFMHELAREGDILSAEVLFDAGTEIDLPDELGRRPLHEAAFFGHLDMVKFLLDSGAILDAPIHPFGHTALYLAVQQSRLEVVQELIRRGARLNVQDALLGTGLLHIAAMKDDVKMAGILIAAGIDVLTEDKNGVTARDAAARQGNTTMTKILLKVAEHHARYGV